MKKSTRCILSILLLANIYLVHSQQITGKIIDSKTKSAVPFATVQYGDDAGVVANAEGYFGFSNDEDKGIEQLSISCMGYLTTSITVEQLRSQGNIVVLEEAINELGTVYITNKYPSVDTIMKRAQGHLKTNYGRQLTKSTIFSRETAFFKPNLVSVEIDKSTGFSKDQIKNTNRQLDSLGSTLVKSAPSQEFTDVLANMYHSGNHTSKMDILKATKLVDEKNKNTFDNIQKKATTIVLKHLDINKTYKLKSGLFKLEDSLSLKDSKKEQEKEDKDKNKKNEVKNIRENTQEFLKQYYFDNGTALDFVMDTSIYKYTIENIATMDNKPVFVIHFEPRKSRAKFSGKLYVVEEDYAITRVDYGYAEGKKGESLNLKLLLGVKYAENVNNVTAIYKKNDVTGRYNLSYVNQEIGRYAYVHRPIKFIENSKDKNKIAFDLKLDGNIIEKRELLNLDTESITEENFNSVTEAKDIEYQKLLQYDPSIWKNHTIIEPLEEMKQFKVVE